MEERRSNFAPGDYNQESLLSVSSRFAYRIKCQSNSERSPARHHVAEHDPQPEREVQAQPSTQKKEEVKPQVQETNVVSKRAPKPVIVGPPSPTTQTANRPSTPDSEISSSAAELCKEAMMAVT